MELKQLHEIPLFRNLTEGDLREVSLLLEEVEIEPGAVFMQEGDAGDKLYIIVDGQVEIVKALGTPQELPLLHCQPGDFIGEMSLINPDGLGTASACCNGPARLLVLHQKDFNRLMETRPAVAMVILRELSTRLRETSNAVIHRLQQANDELTHAYDMTLESWALALALRDNETESHTRRVADLTTHLAAELGVRGEDLTHIRRGAILHDIGKIFVPDSILLKPGPLTDEEWKVMRMHPVYAQQILAPVAFLQKSVEVPYNHHERWDGTGYPRGVKGEAIPLGARIFAVIDVWDALVSDRPYRKALPEEMVLDYLKQQSASHFDPQILQAFLDLHQSGTLHEHTA